MSHTDKTRPLWVRIEDPYNRRHVVEDHDHREGSCDFDGTSYSQPPHRRKRWQPGDPLRDFPACDLREAGSGNFGEFIARNCGSHCYVCGIAQTYYGERAGRAAWRTLVRKMIKLSREDIDAMEEITTSARVLRRFQSKHW